MEENVKNFNPFSEDEKQRDLALTAFAEQKQL